MALPDAPKSLFPSATPPASSARPGPGASFRAPAAVEFPLADPETDAMTAFGSLVQADHDLDVIDHRVSHVRDVRYDPGSNPPAPSPVVFVAAPARSPVVFVAAPVTLSRKHAKRGTVLVLLAAFACGCLIGFAGVFFLTR